MRGCDRLQAGYSAGLQGIVWQDHMESAFILEDLPDSFVWLQAALDESFPGIRVEGASSVGEALEMLPALPVPALALIDLGLPDGSGVQVIEWLNRHAPQTVCIVASIFDDDGHIFPALRAGAHGYLLKDQPRAAIVQALTGIVTGQPPLSPAIARKLLSHFHAPRPQPDDTLTPREREVLVIIAKGMTMAETAALLGLSRNTVAGYVKDIYRKLNVSSRAEAALSARHMGLI